MNMIIILNIFLGIYVFFIFLKQGKDKAVFSAILVTFVPIAGFIFIIISNYLNCNLKNTCLSSENLKIHPSEPNSEPSIEGIGKIDFEKELYFVPIQEALLLNKSDVKRKLLINILKDSPIKYCNILKKATKDFDIDTSHYAASAIAEIKNNLLKELRTYREKIVDEGENYDALYDLSKILKQVIKSKLFDVNTIVTYQKLWSKVMRKMLNIDSSKQDIFKDTIENYLALNNFNLATKYCKLYKKAHPDSEDTTIMSIKLNFLKKNQIGMLQELKNIKNSSFDFSIDAINIKRFWLVEE